MDPVYLGIGGMVALFVVILGWYVVARRADAQSAALLLPADAEVLRKPVFSDGEAALYNLLRLAVQDRYLILAHVPLWCLLDVQVPPTRSRRPVLSHLALNRATFVLLHPGTRQAEKVVEVRDDSDAGSRQERNGRLLEFVLSSAGIQLVRLTSRETYTVPMLAALLEVTEAD